MSGDDEMATAKPRRVDQSRAGAIGCVAYAVLWVAFLAVVAIPSARFWERTFNTLEDWTPDASWWEWLEATEILVGFLTFGIAFGGLLVLGIIHEWIDRWLHHEPALGQEFTIDNVTLSGFGQVVTVLLLFGLPLGIAVAYALGAVPPGDA